MLTRRLALVDTTDSIRFEQLTKVAAAINVQVQRDLAPIWNVQATISAVPNMDAMPVGVSPVMIVKDLPPGEGGVHLSKHRQPYAKVAIGDGWSVAASHEVLELLVDPSGSHLYPSNAIEIAGGDIRDGVGKFQYLVEICDPSEDDKFAYAIDDVTVSDFYTPNYFDPIASPGVRYSFTGAITRPRQVLQGGYLSWFNPATGRMQQLKNFGAPELVDLGEISPNATSLRAFVDGHAQPTRELSRRTQSKSARLEATAKRGAKLSETSKLLSRMF
jgi:hypothetical protein